MTRAHKRSKIQKIMQNFKAKEAPIAEAPNRAKAILKALGESRKHTL